MSLCFPHWSLAPPLPGGVCRPLGTLGCANQHWQRVECRYYSEGRQQGSVGRMNSRKGRNVRACTGKKALFQVLWDEWGFQPRDKEHWFIPLPAVPKRKPSRGQTFLEVGKIKITGGTRLCPSAEAAWWAVPFLPSSPHPPWGSLWCQRFSGSIERPQEFSPPCYFLEPVDQTGPGEPTVRPAKVSSPPKVFHPWPEQLCPVQSQQEPRPGAPPDSSC